MFSRFIHVVAGVNLLAPKEISNQASSSLPTHPTSALPHNHNKDPKPPFLLTLVPYSRPTQSPSPWGILLLFSVRLINFRPCPLLLCASVIKGCGQGTQRTCFQVLSHGCWQGSFSVGLLGWEPSQVVHRGRPQFPAMWAFLQGSSGHGSWLHQNEKVTWATENVSKTERTDFRNDIPSLLSLH